MFPLSRVAVVPFIVGIVAVAWEVACYWDEILPEFNSQVRASIYAEVVLSLAALTGLVGLMIAGFCKGMAKLLFAGVLSAASSLSCYLYLHAFWHQVHRVFEQAVQSIYPPYMWNSDQIVPLNLPFRFMYAISYRPNEGDLGTFKHHFVGYAQDWGHEHANIFKIIGVAYLIAAVLCVVDALLPKSVKPVIQQEEQRGAVLV